ncbi:MAG: tetratricopeptide repeat protein [Methanothrix sp.]|nr:tetratricopeptide repeat protein [Methanothrix sp.]
MDSISLADLDEVDLLLTELEISQGRRNLILCIVASPAYREKVIEVIRARFPCKVQAVEKGDNLIFDLRNAQAKKEEILIWTLPETLSNDILDALNNFRELFYDAGVPSLIFMTPAELDDVIWKAPDFWRYRGGYHILKGEDLGQKSLALEALSMPLDMSYRLDFSYRNEEELLRRKRINEYLLEKISDQRQRGKILAELGIIHSLLSDSHKAIDYYEVALVIARETGDRRGEAIVCWNFGLAYEKVGDLKRAVDHMQISVDFERQMGHKDAEKYADYLKNVRA